MHCCCKALRCELWRSLARCFLSVRQTALMFAKKAGAYVGVRVTVRVIMGAQYVACGMQGAGCACVQNDTQSA
jgi:hypothetical protein